MRTLSSQRLLRQVVKSLYYTARLSRRFSLQSRHNSRTPRRLVHISPAYFSNESLIGGGERYATSLAEATARDMEATLVSFGSTRQSLRRGNLRIEVYPALRWLGDLPYDPLSYSFLKEVVKADVVHCHQYRITVTNLAILVGAALNKRVFVTDYGGVGLHFTDTLPLTDFVDGFLPISIFSAQTLPPVKQASALYGGVNEDFLRQSPNGTQRENILFVGRLLPHKGINYLIEAVEPDMPLEIIGRVYHEAYFKYLQQLAVGKNVRFITDASDEDLIRAYHRALVTVLPSVYTDVYGTHYAMPELLGLVLLEGMASGTPVICTEVGAMPEFVVDGQTGFIVPPNDPATLRERLRYLFQNRQAALKMGQQGYQKVLTEFTWEAVAQRCLTAYQE